MLRVDHRSPLIAGPIGVFRDHRNQLVKPLERISPRHHGSRPGQRRTDIAKNGASVATGRDFPATASTKKPMVSQTETKPVLGAVVFDAADPDRFLLYRRSTETKPAEQSHVLADGAGTETDGVHERTQGGSLHESVDNGRRNRYHPRKFQRQTPIRSSTRCEQIASTLPGCASSVIRVSQGNV